MKQTVIARSMVALTALGFALAGGSALALTTTTTIDTGKITSSDKRVVDKYVTTVKTTSASVTETTVESIKFVDPTLALIKSSDEVSQLSIATKTGGTLTVTANGENGNSAATSNTKLTIASTILGTIGLGVDSCNRNVLGFEVNSGGGCGRDFDIDTYTKGGKVFGESITMTFGEQVTLDSVALADGPFGGNTFAVAVDGNMNTLYAFKMGSFSLWKSVGLDLTGHSFTFLAFDPVGKKYFDNFYISGVNFHTTDVTLTPVPEPESVALALAGLAVVGGLSLRRAKKA